MTDAWGKLHVEVLGSSAGSRYLTVEPALPAFHLREILI